ncbi:MAG: flagellar basal body P-ring protein FlgI [Phycisphaeraceae bacterium]|nr:flagellar basal body P-ring protein FlgI [Phycisphaeraceae bacterium]MCB9847978.1 flagellar basal body P-ring protein FlgI [Phycisphaeraceae bacterium]
MRLTTTIFKLAFLTAAIALAFSARATSIQELVRIQGQGDTILQGFGLVMGLPGTGDSGENMMIAKPMVALLEQQGLPISEADLEDSRSIAIVEITCRIPEQGARRDDRFDVTVMAINNPQSLAGGQLFLTPLRGPYATHGVYAIAEGPLEIEGDNPTTGRVRKGARIVEDILAPSISSDGSLTLVIDPNVSGWTTSQLIASTINQDRVGFDDSADEIAYALDDRTVRVQIPQAERRDPAAFISDILSIRFDPSLLSLPARVVINEREGVIVVTDDVEISPTILAHGDLMITTVSQAGAPNETETSRWATLDTTRPEERSTRLQDLLAAFKQLDVPVNDQIAILMELHRTGALHAELVID